MDWGVRRTKPRALGQVFLDEPRTEMHVHLDQRLVTDATEAVNLPGLDDENVTSTGLELLLVDGPEATAFPHELDFIVRVTVRSGTAAGKGSEEEHRDIHVAVIGPNELVGAALKGEVYLTNSVHPAMILIRGDMGYREFRQ